MQFETLESAFQFGDTSDLKQQYPERKEFIQHYEENRVELWRFYILAILGLHYACLGYWGLFILFRVIQILMLSGGMATFLFVFIIRNLVMVMTAKDLVHKRNRKLYADLLSKYK